MKMYVGTRGSIVKVRQASTVCTLQMIWDGTQHLIYGIR